MGVRVRLVVGAAVAILVIGAAAISFAAPAPQAYKGFQSGECTCYAALEFDKHAPSPGVNWRGDAAEWFAAASAKGWEVSRDPSAAMPGALVVWTGGDVYWHGKPCGHVAVVRSVSADGRSITVEEMNAAGHGLLSTKTLRTRGLDRGNLKFKGYVMPLRKGASEMTPPAPSSRDVTVGEPATFSLLLGEGHHMIGGCPISLQFERLEGGKWAQEFSKRASVGARRGHWDACSADVAIPESGEWRVRAYHDYCDSCQTGYSDWTRFGVQ